MRRCENLKENEQVLFEIYSEVQKKKVFETGAVLRVNTVRREVYVCYMDDYDCYNAVIPFEDMVAVYGKNREYIELEKFSAAA